MARDALPASRLRAAWPRPVTCSEAALRSGERERERGGGGRESRLVVIGRRCMGVWGPSGAGLPGPGSNKKRKDLKTRNVGNH